MTAPVRGTTESVGDLESKLLTAMITESLSATGIDLIPTFIYMTADHDEGGSPVGLSLDSFGADDGTVIPFPRFDQSRGWLFFDELRRLDAYLDYYLRERSHLVRRMDQIPTGVPDAYGHMGIQMYSFLIPQAVSG